jgi:hypothetical protein
MEKSDEVILAGPLDYAAVLSPSGKSVATYTQVRIIRSWKGPHHAGDTLVYGVPVGTLYCEPSQQGIFTRRFEVNGPLTSNGPTLFVLFLRQSKGDEKLVQGLSPAAGEGVQGIFQIQLPGFPAIPGIDSEDYCIGGGNGNVNVKHCDAILQASQNPVMADPWIGDPLAKKYNGMSASDFLREVQSASAQGLAEESSPR